MRIKRVKIHNYRNLDGAEVFFADDCNFIVGENNLGKSNLLSLFNIIFSRRSFDNEDFADEAQPIEIHLRLKLADIEIGHFGDLFDVEDHTVINLVCRQLSTDEFIEFSHLETETNIQSSLVRSLNYAHYDSLRNPIAEINFDKGRGVGRFLNNLLCQYLRDSNMVDEDFLVEEKVAALIKAINDKLLKIKSFKDFGILAMADDDLETLLSKVLILKDRKGDALTKAGYGIQFFVLVTLSFLDRIQSIMLHHRDRGVFEDEKTGKKALSLVLGFDEPEIHLHPYMQRSLLKYLNSIINNENQDFRILLKDLFDIDSVIGQIIVVTQSPNIILNDFRQIIRFYSGTDSIKIISGTQLKLDSQLIKHLYLNFPFIKEAFFSRCAIFVEGDSEYSSLPLFAQKLTMPVDFDNFGICVIQAHGQAIPQLITLASSYGIPSVGMTDRDSGITPSRQGHYQTNFRNFEEELVSIVDTGGEGTLRSIVQQYDPQGINAVVQSGALNKWAVEKYSVVSTKFTNNLRLADIPATDAATLKAFYLTWFSLNKSYPLGRSIGEALSEKEIPSPYKTLISEALKLAQNV